MSKIKLYRVDEKYCDYLRKFDSKISENKGTKAKRPFAGIVFKINSYDYYAPLTSRFSKKHPRKSSSKVPPTVVLIDKGKLGSINFNNMIPIEEKELIELDLNDEKIYNKKEQYMINQQIRWLNHNKSKLYNKASEVYDKFSNKKYPQKLLDVCCDFPFLEEKCKEYNKEVEKIEEDLEEDLEMEM